MSAVVSAMALARPQVAGAAQASDPVLTVAGNGVSGAGGDGGRATDAGLNNPQGVARDGAGNLFIADTDNDLVRKVDTSGRMSTVAGHVLTARFTSFEVGFTGMLGDGGPATAATLYRPQDVAVDPGGNLYIADSGHNRIRRVDPSGTITTVAGGGPPCALSCSAAQVGDGGPATQANLGSPYRVVFDHGKLCIADFNNFRVRKVDLGVGTITTVAGNGQRGSSGDGGPATAAMLEGVHGAALDAAGNLYIAEDHGIRRVDPAGIITTRARGLNTADVVVEAGGTLLI